MEINFVANDIVYEVTEDNSFWSFIRKRVAKIEFESYYLKHYEEIAWQAEKVDRADRAVWLPESI